MLLHLSKLPCSFWVLCFGKFLSPSSLIHSSVMSSLLISPPNVFFIYVTIFSPNISFWFFLGVFISLLILPFCSYLFLLFPLEPLIYWSCLHVSPCKSPSCPTLCDPVDLAHQASLSMEFFRHGFWSGHPFPSLGDLPSPATTPGSPALQAAAFPSEPPGKSYTNHI